MPSITSTRLGDDQISVLQMRKKYCDYISMATLLDVCSQVLQYLCDEYYNGLIFKSKNIKVYKVWFINIKQRYED